MVLVEGVSTWSGLAVITQHRELLIILLLIRKRKKKSLKKKKKMKKGRAQCGGEAKLGLNHPAHTPKSLKRSPPTSSVLHTVYRQPK